VIFANAAGSWFIDGEKRESRGRRANRRRDSGLLAPLRAALDEARAPVDFFLRDDDAGWEDGRLHALLAIVERWAMPIDLAIIPRAITPRLAEELALRNATSEARLGLHQHGFAHANHERSGRKCEFGPSRERAAQRDDIRAGREQLEAALPGLVQPIFTPPWNRCTSTTGEVLRGLGFQVLSRHSSEAPLGVRGLAEIPVAVDWSHAKRAGVRLSLSELGELAAAEVRRGGPVGVNLHHAVMDRRELYRFDDLCALLATHPMAHPRSLLAVETPRRRRPFEAPRRTRGSAALEPS
jgi:hypothetical protein